MRLHEIPSVKTIRTQSLFMKEFKFSSLVRFAADRLGT
jgi:hypothetical protein